MNVYRLADVVLGSLLLWAASCSQPTTVEQPPASPSDKVLTNSIGMKFLLIPAGEFQMGSPETELKRAANEGPRHKVKITRAFYLGVTEVTQGQWTAVMGSNPSYFKGDENLPVETVSWDACQEFLKKLSAKEGKTYRLPTEAEWEYACRAGTMTRYYYGDDDKPLGDHGWYTTISGRKSHPVGQKKPNGWGLYDMHGNVWEWCQDWDGAYAAGDQVDPMGPPTGVNRVARGGSWDNFARDHRSATRAAEPPGARNASVGLRVVLADSPKAPVAGKKAE